MAAGHSYSEGRRGICCDVATDAEWKVKLIVSRAVEHRLPLSVSIPIPVLIGLLMVMLRWGDKRLWLEGFAWYIMKFNRITSALITWSIFNITLIFFGWKISEKCLFSLAALFIRPNSGYQAAQRAKPSILNTKIILNSLYGPLMPRGASNPWLNLSRF